MRKSEVENISMKWTPLVMCYNRVTSFSVPWRRYVNRPILSFPVKERLWEKCCGQIKPKSSSSASPPPAMFAGRVKYDQKGMEMETICFGSVFLLSLQNNFSKNIPLNLRWEPSFLIQNTEDELWMGLPEWQWAKTYRQCKTRVAKKAMCFYFCLPQLKWNYHKNQRLFISLSQQTYKFRRRSNNYFSHSIFIFIISCKLCFIRLC